jgi:hypothetical protein
MVVHGPQMAKKIALWILTLYNPISKSPPIGKVDSDKVKEVPFSGFFRWTSPEQEADKLVNTSPDIGRFPQRNENLGGSIFVREQLIKDLE